MEYYKQLIVKILERSSVANEDKILLKLKSGVDLNREEMRYLEELLDNIL